MTELNYKEAHRFVETNKKEGFFWDGWEIVKWTPGHNGYFDPNGMFKNGKWGYVNRYFLNNKGMWLVPSKYVKHT
jgi:hypothetical protein